MADGKKPNLNKLAKIHCIHKDTVYKTIRKYKNRKPLREKRANKHSTDSIPEIIKKDILISAENQSNIGLTLRYRQKFFSEKYG